MKKRSIFLSILFTAFFCLVIVVPEGFPEDSAIRRTSAVKYGIYLYLEENDSYTFDLDDEDFSVADYFDLDEDYLEISDLPTYGDTDLDNDEWTVDYEPDEDYIGTDEFTLSAYDNDYTTNYLFEVTVLIGEADTPYDFWISMNYDDVDNPVVTDISWSGVYTGEAYTMGATTNLSSDFDDISDLSNLSKTDFQDIEFDDILQGSTTRHYIAMKATRYFSPEHAGYYELPYALLSTSVAESTKYLPSEYSNYLILDYPGSTNPPETPSDVSAKISGPYEAEIFFSGNDNMLDFKAYEIRYGVDNGSGTMDSYSTITTSTRSGSAVIPDLEDDTTYIFQIRAVDYDGNYSDFVQTSLLMEETFTTLQNGDLFEGGCFISGLHPVDSELNLVSGLSLVTVILLIAAFGKKKYSGIIPAALILILIFSPSAYAEKKNTAGMKVGVIQTLDDTQELSYDKNAVSFSLFYDRALFSFFSLEVEAGYIYRDGYEFTESGELTDIETTLTLVPLSSTFKFNYTFTPLITAYIGAGPDLWYYKEENDYKKFDAFDDDNYGVGGYHGKIGLCLKTADEEISKNIGMIIECVYSQIDRFGANEIDLGGVSFNFGLFYQF